MLEELKRHNAIVQERIMKSFGYADTEDFIQRGENLEKAHQDGDIHPKHPDWVWVSSASGGKGDWRKLNGRAHKKHQETNGKKGNEHTQTKTITMSTAPVDTTDKLKSVLAVTDGVYDEEKRKSNRGAWQRNVQKYTENVAAELGKQIGVPFRKNWQGETEVKLGEYSSKDGGSSVKVTLDYDTGIGTFVNHRMNRSAKRTHKGGMVMRIYYPGRGGFCKTINLTEADNAKLRNIVNALKDVNEVKIKDLKNVQGYDSNEKTCKLLMKTLKKYNI